MEKKIGVLVVLIVGIAMFVYSFMTIEDKNEVVSQVDENEVVSQVDENEILSQVDVKEIETVLVEIETNVLVYLDTYVAMMEDLRSNKEMLYDEQESYKGFAHMEALQVKHPELEYIYYGNEKAQMLIRPETVLPETYDPRNRPWYTGAIKSETLVWTQPYMDASEGYMILSGAIQVLDDQQLNGVLGFDLKLNQDIFLASEDLSIAYEVIVLSEWGTIMHHKDADMIGLYNLDGEISKGIEEGSITFEYVPFRTVLNIEQPSSESDQTKPVESKDERTAFVRTNHLGWSIILTVNTDDLK